MKNSHAAGYILVTGAPGSRWSGVARGIYHSVDIDQTDSSQQRSYSHGATRPGDPELKHFGAYWDPGMEFDPDDWDTPFCGSGIRMIKSHTFAHRLEELAATRFPIVIAVRSDVECYEWWKVAGGFSITYPDYRPYYRNLENMWREIVRQNSDIQSFLKNNYERCRRVEDSMQLCAELQIRHEGNSENQNYTQNDVAVYVFK